MATKQRPKKTFMKKMAFVGSALATLELSIAKKDLVKLQHGEYISYGKIEAILKTSPMVESVCMYADPNQNYTVAVVIPSISELSTISPLPAQEAVELKEVQAAVVKSLEKYGTKMGLLRTECPM